MTCTHQLSRRLAELRYFGMLMLLVLAAGCTMNEPEELSTGDPPPEAEAAVGLIVKPDRVTAEVAQRVQFSAYVLGSRRGTLYPIRVEWSASGGTITATGLFTPDNVGTFNITAQVPGGSKDDAVLQAVPPQPDLTAVDVSPDSITLAARGRHTFKASGLRADGSASVIGVEWSATAGKIHPDGLYIADTVPGTYQAIAHHPSSGLRDTAVIVISGADTPPPSGTLDALILSPATVSLPSGQRKQFEVQGQTSDGGTVRLAATYRATGGTIDSTGLYTAGNAAGTYRVIAEASGKADSAVVTITAPSTNCSGSATVICPGDDFAAKVRAAPPGAVFTIRAGVHRHVSVTPEDRQQFIGEPGAVLSGARLLSDWTPDGGRWYVDGQTQQNTSRDSRTCLPDHPGCTLPEQLWIDGVLQQRMTSLAAVASGRWYFDHAADRIYVGVNPSGRTIETSVTPQAFSGSATGVTIKHLTIERYATGSGRGTIDAKSDWTVDAVDAGHNHGTCIRVSGNNIRIRGSRAHHCGEQGIGGPAGSGLVVEDNEIAYNNTAGFGPGGGDNKAAGLKVSHTVGMVIRRNTVHHNPIGLWCDISCVDATFDGNTITDNTRRGIQYEISYGCKILNNTLRRNGAEESGASAAAIWIAQSTDCEVHHNTVEDNRNGIIGTDRDRGSGTQGVYRLSGMLVHHNTVRQMSGAAGGVQDQSASRDPYTSAANNRYESNTYTVGSGTRWIWTNNQNLTRTQWQAARQDLDGSVEIK